MGFKEGANNVWRTQHEGVTYGVDFPKQVIFKYINEIRITEDPDDKFLKQIIQVAELAESNNDENKLPESDNESNNSGSGESTPDATDQSSNQEEPSTTKEVTIPNKNIVTAPNPDLTSENIRQYLCKDATDEEIFMFLQLCEHRKLNPFIKEAYLIKYKNAPATLVVGKDAFMKKAEDNPMFDGFEAGIVTEYRNADDDGFVSERQQGTLVQTGHKIIGGWAKVYRKDCRVPFFAEVSMAEYNTGMSSWKKIPATMIRKVALVQTLREAFPSDLGGCYDSAEMDQARRD